MQSENKLFKILLLMMLVFPLFVAFHDATRRDERVDAFTAARNLLYGLLVGRNI